MSVPGREEAAGKKTPMAPHGDATTYADPGYQKDGVKRYPLDTKEHVQAAWSYINQPGNAAKYDAKKLALIKGRIKTAAQKFGITINEKAWEAALLRAGIIPVEVADASTDTEATGDVEPIDTSDDVDHTGVMVALYPSPELAARLAVDGGEPAEDLHVTMAFLGDMTNAPPVDQLKRAVADWATSTGPITGVWGGYGVFTAGPDAPVSVLLPDLPALSDARTRLCYWLSDYGAQVSRTHGYTPHLTLAYGKLEDVTVPTEPLSFDQVSLVYGSQRYDFWLVGRTEMAATTYDQAQAAREKATALLDQLAAITPPTRVTAVTSVTERALTEMAAKPPTAETTKAFLTEVNGRTLLTAPASTVDLSSLGLEQARTPNEFMLWTQGRFVGAEKANRNGAFWKTEDLEFGEPTVRYGPLNWLHDSSQIVGTIAGSRLVLPTTETAAEDELAYIGVAAPVWKWIYPEQAAVIEMAAEQNKFWYSMECVGREVACVGDNGCGASVDYMTYLTKAQGTCEHMIERSADRRFVDPTFLGGAVIVPPVRPGWAEAHANVMTEAARFAEKAFDQAGRPDVSATDWEILMAQVVQYASMPRA